MKTNWLEQDLTYDLWINMSVLTQLWYVAYNHKVFFEALHGVDN